MPETTKARYSVERAETRDEYWYVRRDDGEVVALFFSRYEAEAYANWKNAPRVSSNGHYSN